MVKSYKPKRNQVCTRMFKKVMEYGHFESETNRNLTKICFLGLNLTPNIDGLWNFDILYLYKALRERSIEARIHDPHIKGNTGISMGVWLGRQSENDNWSHSFDVLILSCPHLYYIKNIVQLAQLFKPNKACMLLDMYGVFSHRLSGIGEHIDIVNFSAQTKEANLLGGLVDQPKQLKQ